MRFYPLGRLERLYVSGVVLLGLLASVSGLPAQGCMPIRFTSPGLGAIDNAYLNDHEWQFGVAYRFLHADDLYTGHRYTPEAAPSGQPIDIHIHIATLNATYAFSRRFSVSLQLPFATGSESIIDGDGLR
ncbi:MAG: hypothetical protein ABJA37_15355, partial [Ferruginibacter sp.]